MTRDYALSVLCHPHLHSQFEMDDALLTAIETLKEVVRSGRHPKSCVLDGRVVFDMDRNPSEPAKEDGDDR